MSAPRLAFSRDPSGRPRAHWTGDAPKHGDLLIEFLETDLGADPSYADRIAAEGRRIAAGSETSWKTTGNAFSLHLAPKQTTLRRLLPDDSPESFRLPTAEFLTLVAQWRHHAQGA